MTTDSKLFEELSFYTLLHSDSDYFIHQLIVDAFTAQTANKDTKKISLVFSLVGLYLLIEKNYTGKQIQQAHTVLSNYKDYLPEIKLPENRGEITISEVLKSELNRDEMIKKWCSSVWKEYESSKEEIKRFCEIYLFGKQ
ncbi:MAG TPA: hypothetical protein ENK44_12790 [Caldithrix abyssi]|uniref:Uncharacterized protein n=1 Tax=Caldithrix abyssi TaxID=187145 RepID=A0A7V4U2Q2_CALAY|nr:hypothetical protein [Caldithrix abyssi]